MISAEKYEMKMSPKVVSFSYCSRKSQPIDLNFAKNIFNNIDPVAPTVF